LSQVNTFSLKYDIIFKGTLHLWNDECVFKMGHLLYVEEM